MSDTARAVAFADAAANATLKSGVRRSPWIGRHHHFELSGRRVPDPVVTSSDTVLRPHVQRVLREQYELDREIGRGGMGIVYQARDVRLKRPVAIKLLPPELAFRPEIRSRFLREAETAAQLSHPNIVPIYAVDEREGLVFFVMALVDGENLAARLHERGPLPIVEARRLLREVADALAYAHGRGVIHRDIKPDNILLSAEDARVMVTDFGIARAVIDGADSRLTATGMAIGTPAYMSPEQALGERELDGRSDLYSLGIVAYQMLTGALPFTAANTPAMLMKHLSEQPRAVAERRPDVPPDLARAVMMLLEKEPANRFPSAQALVVALETGELPDRTNAVAARVATRVAGTPLDRATPPRAPASAHGLAGAASDAVLTEPSVEELARWESHRVQQFRRKLAPFVAVSVVLLVLALFGTNLLFFAGIWGVFIASQYAKLWSDGYDWRDVFRQPKDRLFIDVLGEAIDDLKALFDKQKRAEVRERDRVRARARLAYTGRVTGRGAPGVEPAPVVPPVADQVLPPAAAGGALAAAVREAAEMRDEILRLVETLPRREREQLAGVPRTATALHERIEELAAGLAEIERTDSAAAAVRVEAEIARLEAAANPLDHAASEERVHRLAFLKRQRRALGDVGRRREVTAARLESCREALQSMRYDVLRLRTGAQTSQQLTVMAERAMSLARDVDHAVHAADEVRRIGGAAGVQGPAPSR